MPETGEAYSCWEHIQSKGAPSEDSAESCPEQKDTQIIRTQVKSEKPRRFLPGDAHTLQKNRT